jgi:quercetin dioxygenase-like cupin family protein
MGASFANVAQAIAAHLARVPPASGELETSVRHLRHAAIAAAPRDGYATAPGRDYTAILAPALAAALAHPAAAIAQAIAALPRPLPWRYSYQPRNDAEDLAERVAFAELIGPRAPLTAPNCRAGFTLLAPDTFYPLHAHPAIELYMVIAGEAEWTTPEVQRIVPPGAFVLHHANQPHTMRTFAEPLLALYGWRGDLDTPAFYL